jgi:CDP-2,3-bis-(O-geranylgeranyl)-sn-glycerol synthase
MMIDAALPLLSVLYFLLPAALANVMPVLIKRLCSCGFLATPMDFGVQYAGKPLLGKHKTWRGLVAGVLGGIFFAALQAMIGPTRFDLVDYQTSWLAIGTLLGFGAILGDALKSAFKRRVGIVEGSPWVPFDQIDFTIGALAFTSVIFWPGWPLAVASVAFYGLSHVFIVRVGHALGLRKERW